MMPFKIQLEGRQKVLVEIGGVVIAVVLLVQFLYLPLISQIGEHRATLKNLGVKVGEAHRLAERLEGEEEAMRQARARHLVLERRIADGQSLARILESLHLLAEGLRLKLVAVQPKVVESERNEVNLGGGITLREVSLNLRLEGRYRQFIEFLEKLAQASLIASVQKLRVAESKASNAQLRAEITLAVYLAKGGRLP